MAVNTVEIEQLYAALIEEAEATLVEQFDAGRVKGAEYAMVLGNSLTTAMQLAVHTVMDQPIKDAQALDYKVKDFVMLAESEKTRALKTKQIELATEQGDTITVQIASMYNDKDIKVEQSTADAAFKGAQKDMVLAQRDTEVEKARLIDRQTAGYNDQCRIKKAELYTQIAGMTAASGGVIQDIDLNGSTLHKRMAAAINGIVM